MHTEIVFATGNAGKIKEIREIFSELGMNVRTMKEIGFHGEIIENGVSFAENSEIKARAVRNFINEQRKIGAAIVPAAESEKPGTTADPAAEYENNGAAANPAAQYEKTGKAESETTKYIVMADDSGLEIDYLKGAPGIYSARFAGEDTSYTIKCHMLIDQLAGVPEEKRTARFTTVITAILPDGRVLKARDTMEGLIAGDMYGSGGFGYDPILYLPEYGCTSAELPPGKKNEISHRGKALRAMEKMIKKELNFKSPQQGEI